MRMRRLGNSDLQLTTIGFGAWAIGGGDWAFGWGPQDDAESIRAIHKALDLGVNWIDTAAVYGLGHSERLVASALRDRKGKVIVATKCGLRWRDNRSVYGCLTADSVRKEAEDSLRRLGLETIDLYQIHWPNPDSQIEEAWGAIAELIQAGKVRYGGVSNFDVAQLERVQAIHPVASLQPPYSLVHRPIETGVLPFCREHGIGVVAYSPMQSGLLTGAFSRERLAKLDPKDWRHKAKAFQEPIFSRALELVQRLTPIAQRNGKTMAQLALAWVLRRDEVTSAIAGGRRPAQIEETVEAADWVLEPGDITEIEAILAEMAIPPAGLTR